MLAPLSHCIDGNVMLYDTQVIDTCIILHIDGVMALCWSLRPLSRFPLPSACQLQLFLPTINVSHPVAGLGTAASSF